MFTSYKIYRLCQSTQGYKSLSKEDFDESMYKNFYERLAFFFKDYEIDELSNYIKACYREKYKSFSIFDLETEEYKQIYEKWKSKNSSKEMYFIHLKRGFEFIENFCFKKNIPLSVYKQKYAKRHIREEKYDNIISVYLHLLDIDSLKKVEKLIFKKYIKQYNDNLRIIESYSDVNSLLNEEYCKMKKILSHI